MNARKRLPTIELAVLPAVTALVLFGVLPTLAADPANPPDTPVETVGAVQGSCPKDQLSTDQGCLVHPIIKKKVQPRYPAEAIHKHIQGKVTLGAIVEVDGTLTVVNVLESKTAGQGFEEASIAAAKQWRYTPGRIGNKDVRVHITITTEFILP
jgi:TonB family protein